MSTCTRVKRIGVTGLAGLALLSFAAPPALAPPLRMTPVSTRTVRMGMSTQQTIRPPIFRVLPTRRAFQVGAGFGASLEQALLASRSAFLGVSPFGIPGSAANNLYGGSMGNPYGSPNANNPYSQDPSGGELRGAADILSAQGGLLIANQQAVLLQEEVRRERLHNQRRIFDEWLYERANTPSHEALRQDALAPELSRARNHPPVTEIQSGRSLNRLLASLVRLDPGTTELPSSPLDEDLLKRINVTPATNGAHFGVLKDRGKLQWPLALRDLAPADDSRELREQIESLVAAAIDQARRGRVPGNLLQALRGQVGALRVLLKRNVLDLSFPLYTDARKYLDDLEDGLKVMGRPDAAKYVNGTYALDPQKIKTVQDLLDFMSAQGLTFAPAVAGDEPAYLAVYRALAAADGSSRSHRETQR